MEGKELRIRRLIVEATDQGLRRDLDLWPAIEGRMRAGQKRTPGPELVRGGLLMKRASVFLVAIVALALMAGAVIAIPTVRAQVAKWLGFGVEQQETLPPWIARLLDQAPWQMPPDGKWFQMYTVEFPQARWEAVAQAEAQGLAVPEPGERISFTDGRAFPVPKYLPEGYRWQGMTCLQSEAQKAVAPSPGRQGQLLSLGSTSASGGAPADSANPLPPYDTNVSNYLIGGDRADHLLILAQFKGNAPEGALLQAYHVVSSEGQPAQGAAARVGVIVRPATDQQGLLFLVGACELHETTVGGVQGLWYRGAWNAAGQWSEDGSISLIWQHGDLTYQLTGQGLALAELVHIAESMPS